MKVIAIYGAGGFGKEVACLIRRINEETPTWNFIGFFDDNQEKKGQMVSHFGPCLGGMAELNSWKSELSVVVAVGNAKTVKKIYDRIDNNNISFPNLVHPDFRILDKDGFSIGKGNIIQGGCVASCDVTIGNFNVLNGSVVLGHDVRIDSFNTFMPAVRVAGEVAVGDFNFFGTGSILIQQIKVGNNVRLGAGSVLMTKPKEGILYLGVPARKTEF